MKAPSPALIVLTLCIGFQSGSTAERTPTISYNSGRQASGFDALKVSATVRPLGEFEGRYRVGSTTCLVRPSRMSFEVRWAKGTKTTYFFFEGLDDSGQSVFASSDSGKRKERFIFADSNFNAGKFIGADGKIFSLTRVK